jgi:hypothetical protein
MWQSTYLAPLQSQGAGCTWHPLQEGRVHKGQGAVPSKKAWLGSLIKQVWQGFQLSRNTFETHGICNNLTEFVKSLCKVYKICFTFGFNVFMPLLHVMDKWVRNVASTCMLGKKRGQYMYVG